MPILRRQFDPKAAAIIAAAQRRAEDRVAAQERLYEAFMAQVTDRSWLMSELKDQRRRIAYWTESDAKYAGEYVAVCKRKIRWLQHKLAELNANGQAANT